MRKVSYRFISVVGRVGIVGCVSVVGRVGVVGYIVVRSGAAPLAVVVCGKRLVRLGVVYDGSIMDPRVSRARVLELKRE